MPRIVEAQGLYKIFHLGKTQVEALVDITFHVEKGEFLALVGPSGSGKSTLLNLIGCIEPPTRGTIHLDGIDITNLDDNSLSTIRAERIGFVFQNFNLLPVLTAYENIEYPLHIRGMPKREREERVKALLDAVGLARFANHRPAELSGGQRQRVAIARALAGSPSIVLADEPTANLDHATGREVLKLMKGLNRTYGTTFIFSTHDPQIMSFADRVVELRDGRIAS